MNDVNQTSVATKLHPGRLYVALGVLVPLAALVVYALQLHYNVLKAPWYVPVLGTVGFVSLLMALAQSRSVWRWTATVLVALLVGGEWVSMLVLLRAQDYNGPAKAEHPFPAFRTTLADGYTTFDQESLKGDKNTVMVFFRGRW
jgi:hypothetical protein